MIVLFHNEHGATRRGTELERYEEQHEVTLLKLRDGSPEPVGNETRGAGSVIAMEQSRRVIFVEEAEIVGRAESFSELVELAESHHRSDCAKCAKALAYICGGAK